MMEGHLLMEVTEFLARFCSMTPMRYLIQVVGEQSMLLRYRE